MNKILMAVMCISVSVILGGCGSKGSQTKNDQGAQQSIQLMPHTAKQKKQLDEFMHQKQLPDHHVGTGFGQIK